MQSSLSYKHPHALASRRPRSTNQLKELARASTPISRLLLSALALAAARTWINSSKSSDTAGGEGLVVLGYWAWKIWSDMRGRMKVKKGKRKDLGLRLALTTGPLWNAQVLSLQSISFVVTVGTSGPIRTAALLSCIVLWSSNITSKAFRVVALLSSLLAGGAVLSLNSYQSITSTLAPFVLIVSSLSSLPLSARLRDGVQTKEKPVSPSSASVNILAGIYTIVWLLLLWQAEAIPSPLPNIVNPNAHLLGGLMMLLLSRYLPLPSLTSGNRITSSLSSIRDHLFFLVGTAAVQSFAFPPALALIDGMLILPAVILAVFLYSSSPSAASEPAAWNFPTKTASGYWSAMSLLPPTWRPHLQTILRTPSSSKIFYFLLLNLAYMGVQMAYGVLTNSLGLISDAIHMLFDCLGLAVGLWASVAATWKPDGRYTYGYARVETLSGFANGCFLILISTFIIFEAIQRVMDPPEMETRQLLLVSSIGLAINLWGMYATGGHHHHGHGHGHDHGHGHGHSHGHSHDHNHAPAHNHVDAQSHEHLPLKETKESHEHENGHVHAQGHVHDHKHHHDHSHGHTHEHAHNCAHDTHHDHHNHTDHDRHGHSHSHQHDDAHGHDHAHSHNMRGVFLHVLADTLGSVGVIISTLLIRLTGWTGWDPLASLFIAGLIMASVIPLVIDSGRVLCLDVGSKSESQIRAALAELASVSGLANYASPRFWPRCEGELSGSIHIHLAPSPSTIDPFKVPSLPNGRREETIYANADRVVARVEKVLKSRIRGLTELVVQVEGSEDKSYCGCMTGST